MARALTLVAILCVAHARLHAPKLAPHQMGPQELGLTQVHTVVLAEQQPRFTEKTMPAVSPTIQCVLSLSIQYFIIYTVTAVCRTANQFTGNLAGVMSMMKTATTTVTYAPMLCVLFLGTRMRAIQLTNGETEKYKMPQPWVQMAMYSTVLAVLIQVILVLLIPVFTREMDVPTDKQGNLDMSKLQIEGIGATILSVVRYIVMLALYGGFTTVIVGVFAMQGPKEIWGDSAPPVSPAVMSTIILAATFFLVYLLVALCNTMVELRGELPPMLQIVKENLTIAEYTVNFAPMLSILFIGARMRALQMDPRHGNPQRWAQMCFYGCAGSMLFQTLMALLMPICMECNIKPGGEGEVIIEVSNQTAAYVVTAARYVALVALYGGFTAVIVSVFTISHPTDAELTPPISPAMQCVMGLTIEYFTVYLVLMICETVKQFRPESAWVSNALSILESAKDTVMFAPMLCMLYIGTRMRALQLCTSTEGTIPPTAGPQTWVQEAMFVSAWSVLVQLIMALLVPIVTGTYKRESHVTDTEMSPGRLPEGTNKYVGYVIEAMRYLSLAAMYGGVATIMVGIFLMTPQVLPPYNYETVLPAGFEVPPPPTPPTKAELDKLAKLFF